MKLLFFSDVHGVPERVEKVFEHVAQLAPDHVILLGDVLYHGPRNGIPNPYDPLRVVALLNAHKQTLLAVRGNCDSEVDQMLLEFPIMAPFSEVLTETHRFFITHGHLWNATHVPPVSRGTILVHGHTHIPELRILPEGIVLFNPGSISAIVTTPHPPANGSAVPRAGQFNLTAYCANGPINQHDPTGLAHRESPEGLCENSVDWGVWVADDGWKLPFVGTRNVLDSALYS